MICSLAFSSPEGTDDQAEHVGRQAAEQDNEVAWQWDGERYIDHLVVHDGLRNGLLRLMASHSSLGRLHLMVPAKGRAALYT